MTDIQSHIIAHRRSIPSDVSLICVSKFHPTDAIREAYAIGERDFGESRVLELVEKHQSLPSDIRWHMIGHLQTNKVRQIVPFIHLIHSVDSIHLLDIIEAEAARINRPVQVLLEVHVAHEDSKSGFAIDDFLQLTKEIADGGRVYQFAQIVGLMTMATNTDDTDEITRCFHVAADLYHTCAIANRMSILSMGMSDDYPLAIQHGSNMVRIGTGIFGQR